MLILYNVLFFYFLKKWNEGKPLEGMICLVSISNSIMNVFITVLLM